MKTFLRDYLMLTAVFTVGLTVFVFFTHSTKGFELFIGELTSHGVSKKRLATYLLALFLGLLAVELFCRKFVQQNDQGRFTKPAYILCVVPYALYYGRFGLVMLPLALAFSLLLMVYYHKYKHFKTLFFWQYSIQVAVLPLCMLIAIFFDGQIREIFLFEYKKMHIERENLTYREGWGWVDKVHYRDDHYRYLKAQVDAAKPGERIVLSLHDAWHTPLKIYVQVKRSYDVDVPDTPELRWAVVAGIMLDFMTLSEQTQADSPWYH